MGRNLFQQYISLEEDAAKLSLKVLVPKHTHPTIHLDIKIQLPLVKALAIVVEIFGDDLRLLLAKLMPAATLGQ